MWLHPTVYWKLPTLDFFKVVFLYERRDVQNEIAFYRELIYALTDSRFSAVV